jgi:putative acetyltransferase
VGGSDLKLEIRDERPGDADRIHQVTEAAFKNALHTNHAEQFIVKSLRESGALAVSLVAEIEGEVVGHVALSPVSISDGSAKWYGIGPISVLPEHQRQGIGSELMRMALEVMKAKGAAGCVVLGDPGYYRRFGFKPVADLILPGVSSEYFQALAFRQIYAHGEVAFHEAFSTQACP